MASLFRPVRTTSLLIYEPCIPAQHPQVQMPVPLRPGARGGLQPVRLDPDAGQGVHQGDHALQVQEGRGDLGGLPRTR